MQALTPNPSWLEGVAYDVVSRRHYVDRRRAPSVTQVLGLAYPDRFAHVPPDVLRHKAAIGTAVHAAAHYHAERDLGNGPLIPAVDIRVEAWKWFCASRQVEPLLCETVVCSRDLGLAPPRRRPYIGKLDFLCVVDAKRLVLLDIKTGVPDLAGLQTLAYLDALYQQYPQLIAVDVERWAVVVDADGEYTVHRFRDDASDAMHFRAALECAYRAPDVEWRTPMAEMPMPSFDLPDDSELMPSFDLPDDAPEVLPAEAPTIRELMITPDVDAYLTTLEAAIAPYEATAQAFAAEMRDMPIDTPQQLAALGQQSLIAKEREQLLDELFEPAIRKPRLYLDRVYAVKRRVVQFVKTGGETAARRYTLRKRELEDLDRLARLEADRKQRAAQAEVERVAAAERRRLADEAMQAAQQGQAAIAAELIERARAVEPEAVTVACAPVLQAPAADVAGLGVRAGWTGEITDMKDALMAAARPDIFREVAALIEDGQLTVAGGQSPATHMIATRLRALATELPIIPSTMFAGNADALKKRAAADHDTLQWPGFTFTQTVTPVRRTAAARSTRTMS
jgi:hypothetical protein